MSNIVKERLRRLGLLPRTTHEDRIDIDKEIGRRTGVYCDEAVSKGMISDDELKQIVEYVLNKKKIKKRCDAEMVV